MKYWQLPFSAFIALTMTAYGCSASESESGSDSATGATESKNLSPPAVELISQADTSATVSAVRSGLNPETTIISSKFYCYEVTETNFQQAKVTFDINGNDIDFDFYGNDIASTLQPGPDTNQATAILTGNSTLTLTLEIKFNEFGQVLKSTGPDNTAEGCYQEGAAHEAALHRYLLNTPSLGAYQCLIHGTDTIVSAELLSANQYRFAGQTGTYQTESIATGNSSDILFVDGPLRDVEADYSEDPETGIQTLSLDELNSETFITGSSTFSTSQLALCQQQSEPKPFKRYGPNAAPPATNPETALNGLYFIDASRLTTTQRNDRANYVEFDNSGYVYAGLPLPGGTNCALTKPNGLPLCDQYQFDGRALSIVHPWNDTESLSVTTHSNGTLKSLDEQDVEIVTPIDAKSIVGTWASQNVRSSSLASCMVGACRTSITNRAFHFREDGQYLFTTDSESNSSMDTGATIFLSGSNSNDEGSGSYSISGTRIELTSASGRVEELPIHRTQKNRLSVGLIQYSPK